MCRGFVIALLCCAALLARASDPASTLVDHPTIKLIVDGKPSDVFDQAALAAMPRASINATAKDEAPTAWQGVPLYNIVRRACVASDDALIGRALARFVRVTSATGQQVVFSAAELDPNYGNLNVILADRKDGKPLGQDGPYRLVVPKDTRSDRWLGHVTLIEVVDASTP